MDKETNSIGESVLILIRQNLLFSALVAGGLIFLSIGLIQFLLSPSGKIEFKSEEEVKGLSTEKKETEIMVDVSGEVVNPGVYRLKSSSRIQDALDAAGGITTLADYEYVSKSINLAAIVKDEAKIYIPKAGETQIPQSNTQVFMDKTSSSLVSINASSQSELESLPGVGSVTAQKIIGGRPYASVDELLSKKIVGAATFSKIKDLISP
ncbi:MAG TPA: ComEA family DNA-binding protein [Candidatus Levybacteria bacterium]|nr:ComEA family DNA-binding protein [Candidatus Levybacteria bacterium]